MNKQIGKVTDIAVRKAKRLIRQHICPFCNTTMVDEWDRGGVGLWTCLHCNFKIYDHHLYHKHLDFLAAIIRTKIREKKLRLVNKDG
ncbi:MAG TPA: hypothetical protein EYP21_08725 [Syntrophaceae bacterium]|nr:hypothetical protein [Syntrophaceae bacterium]